MSEHSVVEESVLSKDIKCTLSIIVARAENGVIGRDNGLPWRLPEDLKYFKRTTMGHPIIMGRKTYESIGKPLPGRTNIVVTRQADWHAEGVVVANSVEQALMRGEEVALADGVSEIMIIGGEQFYRAVLPISSRLYLTEVHASVDGDAYFPSFDPSQWNEVRRVSYAADSANPYPYSFVVLDKVAQ